MKDLKEIEYIINEEDNRLGTYAISLVKTPAMEADFINLSTEDVNLKLIDEERGVLMGTVLIPEKRILRRGAEGSPDYYIYFTKETIRKTSELYLEHNHQSDTTLEHQTLLSGNTVVETWIKEDEVHDKSVLHKLDAPLGSWVVTMKINDPALLDLAKEGELNGFSIEGRYDDKSKTADTEASVEDEVEQIKQLITEAIGN